jgi:hypothetical protein
MFAAVALRKLTGEDLGYDPSAPAADREKAILAWRQWLAAREHGGAPIPEDPAGTGPSALGKLRAAASGPPGGGPE